LKLFITDSFVSLFINYLDRKMYFFEILKEAACIKYTTILAEKNIFKMLYQSHTTTHDFSYNSSHAQIFT